jgi:branched-chain amino acid aminotransferase
VTEPIAYVGGEFVPESRAAVSILDHGLLYGDGVFETVLARGGAVHRLDAHLGRLFRSLAAVRIAAPHDRDGFAGIVAEALRRNDLADAYVKLVVTRGSNGTPLLDPRGCEPGVICLVRPHTDDDPSRAGRIRDGLRVKTAAIRRPPSDVLDPKVKSLNYLNLVLARLEARSAGMDEALLLDVHGHVCEAPGANIFTVSAGTLSTPDHDILEGVTRATVVDLAQARGWAVRERAIDLYDVYTADEVVLCSTAIGLLPVVRVDGRTIGSGAPGPVFAELLAGYRRALRQPG